MERGQRIITKLNTKTFISKKPVEHPTDVFMGMDGDVHLLRERGRWCKQAFRDTWIAA